MMEPIAIVGIGCRFPGGIYCPRSFWKALCEGRDCITEVPADRWDLRSFYNPDGEKKGKIYTRKGGFLENIGYFDPQFFGISPREAPYIDPQQRLLLEVTWEALEDGGIAPESLAGSRVGVFVGLFMHDYENIHFGVSERKLYGPHSATGMSTTIAANRISYVFDFRGPSIIVDTACSSSLVAVHLACKSIWDEESEIAVAGGANVLLKPEMTMVLCKGSFLSPDGYCKSFDARANGYTRSEGAGMVVLKRMSQALEDGNPVYALIRGSAVNQDGQSQGLTVPNIQSHIAVIGAALREAEISPEKVQYVEAHGTGTEVGDPIEASALGSVLSPNRSEGDYCFIGSVKSNLGHTESAAGVASLIKSALMLKHGQIPPNLHFETPNPKIPFEELKLRVPTSLEPWPDAGRKSRIAGVNSFGFGGTNAHIVLEGPETLNDGVIYEAPPRDSNREEGKAVLVPLSGHTPEALKAVAKSYFDFLISAMSEQDINLIDIGYTTSLRRGHNDHRLTIAAHSRDEFTQHLEAYLAGEKRPGMSSGLVSQKEPFKLAFVFSGMGTQWSGMGSELFEKEAVFREVIEACDALFREHTPEWLLLEELMAEERHSRINETNITQPCIFSVQVALAALWRSWGIIPDAIVGHSVGEIAASHVAGVLTLEDAVLVCFHRGRLQQQKAGQGSMLAVNLSSVEVERLLEGFSEEVSIAAVNSPTSVTLSGDTEALKEIAGLLEEQKIFARFLNVEVPFHSPLMQSILPEFQECLKGIQPQPAPIPLISTVTGTEIEWQELNDSYWPRNTGEPVRFSAAFGELIRAGHNVFIEVSPHPALAVSMIECLSEAGKEGVVIPSLRRSVPEEVTMLGLVGTLYTKGYPIDWNLFYPEGGKIVRLPSYPWQREYYWAESEESQQARKGLRMHSAPAFIGNQVHPLLGGRLESAVPTWNAEIDLQQIPYLGDHVIQGSVVYPAAAYLEMALTAAKETADGSQQVVREVEIKSPLFVQKEEAATLQFLLEQNETFSIYSKQANSKNEWVLHATGKLENSKDEKPSSGISIPEIKKRCTKEITGEACYQLFRARGIEYGPTFQGIELVWAGQGEALGKLKLADLIEPELEDYHLHPVILDACFQVLGSIPATGTYLPVKVGEIRLCSHSGDALWCYARLVNRGFNHIEGDIQLFDDSGILIAEVKGLHCKLMEGFGEHTQDTIDGHLYEYQWMLQARPGRSTPYGNSDHLPSPYSILERIEPEVRGFSEQYAREQYYAAVKPKIDALCGLYIVEALRKLGWKFEPDISFTSKELIERLGVIKEHHRFLSRLLEILEQERIVKRVGQKWEILRQPAFDNPQKTWAGILSEYPTYHAELTLLERCGSKLKEVLRGEVDPLSIIFPPGSPVIEHLYHGAPTSRIYNRIIKQAIGLLLDSLPEGETLRTMEMLEIGAGTGGMTSRLLPLLPANHTKYLFTDISQVFINQADRKIKDYKFLECQVFDIEKDLLEQGFDPHSFDLILAADVIHATSDLRGALDNVKRLLKPKGLLFLIELTNPSHWFHLAFGMLKGWWLFSDTDLRVSHPLLKQRDWISLLLNMGFHEAVGIADREDEKSLHSVIIAQGPEVSGTEERLVERIATIPEKTVQAENGRPWLILADDQGIGDRLAELLASRGIKPTLIQKGDSFEKLDPHHFSVRPEQPEDIDKILDTIYNESLASPIIIYLWSLATSAEEITCRELEESTVRACVQVLHIVQSLMKRDWDTPPCLWLATNGTQPVGGIRDLSLAQTSLWGLGRVIVTEHPDLQTRLIDISPIPSLHELGSLIEEVLLNDGEDEVVLRGERRYLHRMIRKKEVNTNDLPDVPYCLSRIRSGGLGGLNFQEMERKRPGPGEVEVQVRAAGINFKDVAKATGLLDDSTLANSELMANLGLECSGVITDIGEDVKGFHIGDEVMGLVLNCFASHAITDPRALVHKPADLSFEEAATIPLVFLASYYALNKLARVKEGEYVLIHAAAGGVGLSAIQVARAAGAEILATASTSEKRDFLKALGIKYVGDSRSLAFVDEVMEFTNQEGVDIVLNTLPARTIAQSMSALRPVSGRFVDISNVYEKSVTLFSPDKGISFFTFDLESMIQKHPDIAGSLLSEMIKYFNDRTFHPIPYRVFPVSEIERAFRSMRKGVHIGKVVVSFEEPGVVPVPTKERINAPADGTYLITGGLGGFGLSVAQWLVSCGARHLVLAGRSGASTPEAEKVVESLREFGAEVAVETVDVTQEGQVRDILNHIDQSMPPLRGVVHAAMVLDDAPLMRMDASQMKSVMDPKILGAWNLHVHTLHKPLDFFICFSSFASLVGSADQGNYAAANSFLDSLAYYRHARGLPALTICWGPISGVGYVANHEEIREHIMRQGVGEITLNQAWRAIIYGLKKGFAHIGVIPADWNIMGKYSVSIARSPRFSGLTKTGDTRQEKHESEQRDTILSALPEERKQALTEGLTELVASILGIPVSNLSPEQPLDKLGFDSLMAVELLVGIESIAGLTIPKIKLLRKGLNIRELVEIVENELPAAYPVSPPSTGTRKETVKKVSSETGTLDSTALESMKPLPVNVDHLSDEEVKAMLASMLSETEQEHK